MKLRQTTCIENREGFAVHSSTWPSGAKGEWCVSSWLAISTHVKKHKFFHVCWDGFSQGRKSLYNIVVYVINHILLPLSIIFTTISTSSKTVFFQYMTHWREQRCLYSYQTAISLFQSDCIITANCGSNVIPTISTATSSSSPYSGIYSCPIITTQVYHEPTELPASSWLVSSVISNAYSRGHGFHFRASLNIFRLYFHYC